MATHDDHIKRNHNIPLRPIRLRVRRHVVHQEARSQQNSDLVQIKQQHQRPSGPPRNQYQERHPEERELDAEVDRAVLGERLGWLGF